MKHIDLRSVAKTLSTPLNSWETLEVFDVPIFIDGSYFEYTVDGFVLTLKERGIYHLELVLNMTTSGEDAYGIRLRLNINGVDQEIKSKGYIETTVIFHEYIAVSESSDLIIKVFFETDGAPDLVVNEDNMLYITKTS